MAKDPTDTPERMERTQFTREDWRPSPKRGTYPRVRDWGGQKKAPKAFLEAAKVSGIGSGKLRLCLYCGKPAVREADVCRYHGGGKIASEKRPYVKSATWIGIQAETATEAKADITGTTDTVPDTDNSRHG
jgi:hypothetical protein